MADSDQRPMHAQPLRWIAERIRSGQLSAVAYTRALIARRATVDSTVDAWAHFDAALAIERAQAADRRRTAAAAGTGNSGGCSNSHSSSNSSSSSAGTAGALPLDGIPIGVKDILATADQPTQMGSPAFEGHRPERDAYCVSRLRNAGAFVVGKTVTTELAFMHPSKTRNPWNPAHTPGGSSSGSAAAVASGQVPGAIGTQTNGSVIRPSAFCGVVGFKPSFGTIPFAGGQHFSPTLDQIGVITRCVDDAALLASAIGVSPAIATAVAEAPRPPRLGVLFDLPWIPTGCGGDDTLEHCMTLLRRQGAEVRRPKLPEPCGEARQVLRTIMMYEAVEQLGALQERARDKLSARLNGDLDGARNIGVADYANALARRREIIASLVDWMAGFDAIVLPPAPGGAPASLDQTGDPSFCTLWSLAGFPSITLPVGKDGKGMPLGMQLASVHGDDDRLLSAARWCEARLPFEGLV